MHKNHELIHTEFPVKLMVSNGLFVGKILTPSWEGMMGGIDWPISLGPLHISYLVCIGGTG